MAQNWFHTNLLWPALQSMAGAGILAIVIAGNTQITSVVGGCPTDVSTSIAKGEQSLANGDTARALSIAEDGLVVAPDSPCANVFAAAVELQMMRERLKIGDHEAAERYRARCFRHANQASPVIGVSPRVGALRKSCQAS